jgi:hypothetical protein
MKEPQVRSHPQKFGRNWGQVIEITLRPRLATGAALDRLTPFLCPSVCQPT